MDANFEPEPDIARQPKFVAMVSLEHLHGYQPEHYLGAVLATGATVYEAVEKLEQRTLELVRTNLGRRRESPEAQVYVLLGLRFAGTITASGQPEWVAYGTLARGTALHEETHLQRPAG